MSIVMTYIIRPFDGSPTAPHGSIAPRAAYNSHGQGNPRVNRKQPASRPWTDTKQPAGAPGNSHGQAMGISWTAHGQPIDSSREAHGQRTGTLRAEAHEQAMGSP